MARDLRSPAHCRIHYRKRCVLFGRDETRRQRHTRKVNRSRVASRRVASAWRDACRRRFKSTLSTTRTSENQRVRFRRRIYSGRWKRTVSRRRVAFLVGESRFPCRLHARIIAFVPIFDLPAVCTALTVSLASFKDRVEPTATRRPFFLLLYLRYRLPSKSPARRGFYRRASVGFSSGSIVRVPDPSDIV